MREKQYLLFDLDGTLTDPKAGITKSVQYALQGYGICVEDLDQLCCFIGPPLKDSFMEYYGFSPEKADEAINRFREYFAGNGLFDNEEFPGIDGMLKRLKDTGRTLLVATSKPEAFAKQILEHFGLDHYFSFVGGALMDETRTKKAEVIRYVLDSMKITDLSGCVMIGDRKHDILGAREVGMQAIGVLYGYGDREELVAAKANAIVETVAELETLLTGKEKLL